MTSVTGPPQAFIDIVKDLAVQLTRDATHNPDRERRQASANWLGLMKYDDEPATRLKTPRSPFNEALYQAATARLPVINAFIATADTEQLRHVIEGLVIGIDNELPDPAPDYMSTPHTIRLFADLVADITQQDDPVLRQRAGRRIGTLKHHTECGLRGWDYTNEQHHDLETEVAAIDDFITQADAHQLRDIIHGFTTAIRT